MKLIVLSGVTDSGKTTILDKLYTKLDKNKEFSIQFERGTSKENGNSVNDHRVLFRGKDKNKKDINVVITSQGDNTDELALNVLFFIESSLICKEKNIDYWVLSENTGKSSENKRANKITGCINKLFEYFKIVRDDECVVTTTNTKDNKENANNNILSQIIKKLNIEEVNDEVQ